MVLPLSRSVLRSLGPVASRLRPLHTSSGPRRTIPSRLTPFGPGRHGPALNRRSNLGPSWSIRMLTSQREKVKVLLVLYDGGQHALDVSSPSNYIPISSFSRLGLRVSGGEAETP